NFATGTYHAGSYAILTATGGVNGTFGTLNVLGTLSASVRNPHLVYDTDDVFLVLDVGTITTGGSGLNGNQTNVANGINNAVLFGGAPGDNPGALGYARAFADDAAVPPQAAAAYAAVTPKDRRANNFEQRWGVWGASYGGYNKTGGDAAAGTNDLTARTWGLAAGADYRVSADTVLGFALGGGTMNWGLAQNLGGGRSDVFQLGVYGKHTFGAAYIAGALSYAAHNMTTDRTVTAVVTEQEHASFNAQSFGGRLETGYRFLTPYAGI